jgi:hypothetical protein
MLVTNNRVPVAQSCPWQTCGSLEKYCRQSIIAPTAKASGSVQSRLAEVLARQSPPSTRVPRLARLQQTSTDYAARRSAGPA